MIKISTLLFALLFINVKPTVAQTLSIGPMIGGNISTISKVPYKKNLLGLSVGGFLNYSVNDYFGFSAKIMYSQLGTAYTSTTDITRLHYLQIPVTAVYYLGDAGNQFRPKIFVGPYLGILLKANNKNGDEFLGTDGTSAYNRADIGALIGAGFNYRIQSRTWINVDAGFGRGFSDITKTPDNQYHNTAFSLNIGISFPVGKD